MTTLVLVGNGKQPFRRLLDAVNSVAAQLPQPVIVQHGSTPFSDASCEKHAFLDRDAFSAQIKRAEVVICHAGAGCAIETLRTGKVPVVMPRKRRFGEVIDDHQVEFASALLEAGKAIVIEEPSDLVDGVMQALALGRRTKAEISEMPLVALVRDALRLAAAEREPRPR